MVRRENFSLPPSPRRQYFREKFLGALFNTQSAPRSQCRPPQSFDASYAPVFNFVSAGADYGQRLDTIKM
jgi:hypothetical protein